VLALERAAALQRAAVQEVSERFTAPAAYTLRDLEAAATAAGIPVRLVMRAVAELPVSESQ
jgi:hypothetical protein